MAKVPKVTSLRNLFAVSQKKNSGMKLIFSADEHQSFLQINAII